jgi:hypothetical protein
MPKSSLEGFLKEQLELEASRGSEINLIRQRLGAKLQKRGVQLKDLEHRPIGLLPSVPVDSHLQLQLWEYWLDELPCNDGFSVSLDMVVGSLLSEQVLCNRSHYLILKNTLLAALRVSISDNFVEQGVEKLVASRKRWSRFALSYIQQGHFEKTINEFHVPLLGPGHKAGAIALWVTDMRIKAQPQAFRPTPKRYADPLTHLYFYSAADPLANLLQQSQEERR